jgi:hypothetical protein
MGTVLEFRPTPAARPADRADTPTGGEIVIFPGVRIERFDLDLGYRVRNATGCRDFDGVGPKRPRKTS